MAHRIWSFLLATPLTVGCFATTAKPARPELPKELAAVPVPVTSPQAGSDAGSVVGGFIAICRVGPDLPAALNQQLVLLAELHGRQIREVPLDAAFPADLEWNVVAGGGTVRVGEPEVIQDGDVRVVSAGTCTEDGSIWATVSLGEAQRPDLPGADAIDALVAERAAASEAERTDRKETSFEENYVRWFVTAVEAPVYLRVSSLDSGWVECEPPTEPGGDSTCGSSEETHLLIGRVGDGLEVETIELLVESAGC